VIRSAALLFLASVIWVLPAFPDATYYLVDNSGSMTNYREGENGVDREVEGLVRGNPTGSEVYVQYFRGNTMMDCESPVSLPDEPVLVSNDFTLDPRSAGGSTLILHAVSALYGIDAETDAAVVLYTDGSFEDSVCETPQQICSALLDLQRDRPRMRFKFEAPKLLRESGAPVLSCAGLKPFDQPAASDGTEGISEEGDDANKNAAGDERDQSIVWPPLIALLLLPLFAVVPFVINILSIRRFTVDIETADKIFDPHKKLITEEVQAYWAAAAVIIVTLAVIVAYYVLNPDARDTHLHWFDAANKPLLSIVYAYAYTVVLGWYFVERMRDSHARKQNEWKVSYNESVRQFEVSEVSRIQGMFATARRDRDEYERRLIGDARSQLEAEASTESESIQQQILELSNHMQAVKSRIHRALGEVASYQNLRGYQNASFTDYDSVAELLLISNKIDNQLAREVRRVFATWSNLLDKLPRIDTRLERIIMEFDLSAFDSVDGAKEEQ
tara:strand:+ start:533 stop:2035 length:1503 start_codon:yes stop_codon:yes gene_type:complete